MKFPFFQINKNWGTIEKSILKHCPQALNFWWSLAPLTNELGAVSISQRAIKKVMGVRSRSTIGKAVKYLHSAKLLLVGKIGNQNTYILDPKFINKTHKQWSTKKLAKLGLEFPSNTVILKSENRSDYDSFNKYIKCYKSGKLNLKQFKVSRKQAGKGQYNRNGEWVHGKNQYSNVIHHHGQSFRNPPKYTMWLHRSVPHEAEMNKHGFFLVKAVQPRNHKNKRRSMQNKKHSKHAKRHQVKKSSYNANVPRQQSLFDKNQDYGVKKSDVFHHGKNKRLAKNADS